MSTRGFPPAALEKEPWRGLQDDVADLIEPEIPSLTGEILATIAAEVPEYARPLEGAFGRGIQVGVSEALRQFVSLVRDPDAGREQSREVYVDLGRGEFRSGRSLDTLQAAYRVGARVALRRVAALGLREQLPSEVVALLSEAIFAYIDELSADSVEGYAQELSALEGELQRRRRELLSMLLREPPPDQGEVEVAATAASWSLPRSAAALACAETELGRLAARLGEDALLATVEDLGCVVLADPQGPGRSSALARAVGMARAALGPSGPPAALPLSWRLAREAIRAAEAGAIGDGGLIRADDHLAELMLFESGALIDRIAARRLAALDELTPSSRERLEQTALAYLSHRGNAAATARALHLHPQTVRYRLARIGELLGDALDDPDTHFELEAALRRRAWTQPEA